jgi:hypothetical protein
MNKNRINKVLFQDNDSDQKSLDEEDFRIYEELKRVTAQINDSREDK